MNRMKLMIIGMAAMLASMTMSEAKDGDVILAKNGKALAAIVVNSEDAIPAEKTAAKELSDYLKKITGAEFATVEEKDFKGGPAIYVGNTAFAKKAGIDIRNCS